MKCRPVVHALCSELAYPLVYRGMINDVTLWAVVTMVIPVLTVCLCVVDCGDSCVNSGRLL